MELFFSDIFGTFNVLLGTTTIAFFVKLSISIAIIYKKGIPKNISLPHACLLLLLTSTIVVDSAWMLILVKRFFIPSIPYSVEMFWIRVSWASMAIQYQALVLFLESLVHQQKPLEKRQLFFILISSCFVVGFIALALYNISYQHLNIETPFNLAMQQAFILYGLFLLIPFSVGITLHRMKSITLPRILHRQLKVVIRGLIIPQFILDSIQYFPFDFPNHSVASNPAAVSVSTIIFTCVISYCARQAMNLRFLNLHGHVETKTSYNFVRGFKDVLQRFSQATTCKEITLITQEAFRKIFSVPTSHCSLYGYTYKERPDDDDEDDDDTAEEILPKNLEVESFFGTHLAMLERYMRKNRVLIYDEVAFSNFYATEPVLQATMSFLDKIEADVFIPIISNKTLIGYIIIDRFARSKHEFYGSAEHNEMAVFASYLGNIIYLFQTRNLSRMIKKEQRLQKELHTKRHELAQYKESIQSFVSKNKYGDIGIIFYKNKNFFYANQTAKDMVGLHVGEHKKHPITRRLKKLIHKVQEHKTKHHCMVYNKNNQRIVFSALPDIEQKHVIVIVHYPGISDVVRQQIAILKNPSKWDYLLYLETTQSGRMVNQLVPGSSEQLLNFKVAFLEAALSPQPLLLEMHDQDLMPTVHLLHHIGMKGPLHTVMLSDPQEAESAGAKLFGSNLLLDDQEEQPLLTQAHNGTLFIKNIHLLDKEAQEHLAEFLTYGLFRMLKSDQKIPGKVRIICSTNKDLHQLALQGLFDRHLLAQLNQQLVMPSLPAMTDEDLTEIAQGYAESTASETQFKNILSLTEKETEMINSQRPTSLKELRTEVHHLLKEKAHKSGLQSSSRLHKAFDVSHPDLMKAAHLGKHALQDEKIMHLLWGTLKSQTKIAEFLGVNRSSVNRRCKQFNLQ